MSSFTTSVAKHCIVFMATGMLHVAWYSTVVAHDLMAMMLRIMSMSVWASLTGYTRGPAGLLLLLEKDGYHAVDDL